MAGILAVLTVIRSCLLSIWNVVSYPLRLFPRLLSSTAEPIKLAEGTHLTTNGGPVESDSPDPMTLTFTVHLQPQFGLEVVGAGAVGIVYKVDEHVVLKAYMMYEQPSSNSSLQDHRYYASQTIFNSNLIEDERAVFKLLEQQPHPNIVEPIDTRYPEGIYLRRYCPLTKIELSTQRDRVLWYQDIIRALVHLHNLGLVHSDLRVDNIFLDKHRRALLGDFSASSPFGHPNPAFPYPDLPVPFNGLSETVSDATDRFAMGSLIYFMETGSTPDFTVGENGGLVLPALNTGNTSIDSVIRKAWLGMYTSSTEMLVDAESVRLDVQENTGRLVHDSISKEELRDRIKVWRTYRETRFGSVLNGLHSGEELKSLADRYGWSVDKDRCFAD